MKFRKYKLEDVCNIQIGKTPRREVREYWGKGYSWVSISDMKSSIITTTKEEITESAIKDCGCKLIPKGTILMSFKLSIGKLAFAGKDLYTNEAIVGLEIKDKKLLHTDYLLYVLKIIPLVGSNNAAMGATLNKESLKILQLPIPSLSDQLHIANLLSKAENLITQRKQSIALLDEYLKSTFLEMFGDPVRNEKGWEIERLDKIAKLQRGRFSPRPRNDPSYFNGKYPFIQTGDISKSGNRLNSFTQTLNEKGIKVSKEFKKGTIVIAIVGATIGATAILEIDVYATDSIIGIIVKKEFTNNLFLEFTMQLWKPILLKNAPEAARANINLEILGKLGIIMPPHELQTQFAQIVEKTEVLKAHYQSSLQELKNLYGSISQRAFLGELTLNQAEEQVLMAAEPEEAYQKQ